jgi:hypothetical protein
MKATIFIGCVLIARLSGDEPVNANRIPSLPSPPVAVTTPSAWLGLRLSKPDPSLAAHIERVPPGIGFVVTEVETGSPAEKAELKPLDLIWKLGDQLLVNEAQLAVLLRLHKPGDQVKLSAFRSGKAMTIELSLGRIPLGGRAFPSAMVETSVLPDGCSGPMRVINVAERSASFSGSDGTVSLRRVGNIDHLRIEDPKGVLILEKEIAPDAAINEVPDQWQRRVFALRRGLDQALANGGLPTRQPRPRVVPPAAVGEK